MTRPDVAVDARAVVAELRRRGPLGLVDLADEFEHRGYSLRRFTLALGHAFTADKIATRQTDPHGWTVEAR